MNEEARVNKKILTVSAIPRYYLCNLANLIINLGVIEKISEMPAEQ